MHLLVATDDFRLAGQPLPGFPILLWPDMSSCEEANEFLRFYLMRGSIGSKKSWPSTARALYDYFSFLNAHDLCWNDVDRGEQKPLIGAYRDYCFDAVRLSRNTVRQRVRYICSFYEFAVRRGWIGKLPFEYEQRTVMKAGGFLAHNDASGGVARVPSPMPRKHRDLPRFLTQTEVRLLYGSATNPHHQLMIRLALQTGLRREEVATFPVAYVSDPSKHRVQARNIRVTLDPQDGTGMKTKGGRRRTILVSARLMRDLHHYVVHRRGERPLASGDPNSPVFLNKAGRPFADDGKGIERVVSRIGRKVGIKAHPHMLRHTYATHTLAALQRHKHETRLEPLVFLQKQLGHASIATTMVYLHLINEMADDAVLAYDDELNALGEGSA